MIEVDGLQEVIAAFDDAAKNVDKRAAKAVRAAAGEVVSTAKGLAPVRTGVMRDSITATGPRGGALGARSLIADVGPSVFYARFVEYGTSKMSPEPFMAPSLDRNARRFVDGVIDAATEDL